MNQEMLNGFERYIEENKIPVHDIVVYQDGQVKARKNWDSIQRRNIYSVTKSLTATAVGIALDEGWFQLDSYVTDLFPNEIEKEHSPLLEKMQIKHLLTMTMGYEEARLMGAQRANLQGMDWIRYVLNAKMCAEPGDTFLYNNAGPYLLGVLVQRFSGVSLETFLWERVLKFLDIDPVTCFEKCPSGYTFGAGGFYLNVDELAKIGLLYLQDGRWEGKQVLPKGWSKESGRTRTFSRGDNIIGYTYGYLFWVGPDEKWFFAHGKYDQIFMILPERNAVIAATADEHRPNKPTVHAIAKTIIPVL